MPIERLQPSFKFNEDQLNQLRQIAPEAFKDNCLDYQALYDALADQVDQDEFQSEHYELSWPGKKEAKKMAALPPRGTLIPVPGEGVNEENTRNIFIEGENLEVLKLLQKAYAGRIKMIYIDPPYNTGNDFIYEDDFSETIEEYLKRTGQLDDEGKKLTTNTRADGRFHSKWLSMMYPRLKLAWNLLSDDGVLFVSIDDNEAHNLRQLLGEIFGEENFVAQLVWSNKEGGGSSDSKNFRIKHEYILCYSRVIERLELQGVEISNLERYTCSDKFVDIRGPYYLQKLGMGSIQYSKSLDYQIETPDKTFVTPAENNSGKKACWRWSKQKYEWGHKNGFIEVKKDKAGTWIIYTKQYLKCDNNGNVIERTQRPFGVIDAHSSTQASKYLEEIGLGKYFSYSKPSDLIKYIANLTAKDADIVLDFFSGSGTTAHAVLDLNKQDNGNRKFILVQLPEPCPPKSEAFKAGYKNIADIGKERIRRIIKKNKEEQKIEKKKAVMDLGFKVFKFWNSNFRRWQNYTGVDAKQLETLFSQHESLLIEDWKPENLLSEILLLEGFPLDSAVEQDELFTKNTVSKVTSDFCEHALFVSLDKKIKDQTIQQLNLGDHDIFICLDTAITDQDKIRLDDKGLIKTI